MRLELKMINYLIKITGTWIPYLWWTIHIYAIEEQVHHFHAHKHRVWIVEHLLWKEMYFNSIDYPSISGEGDQ